MERALSIVVIMALGLATAAMFAVSMRANYLYGYSIGQTPDTQVAIAWANVAADLWKGFGLIVTVGLWRAKARRAAVLISLTWLVCLSFSVSSAIGVYVQERSVLTGTREALHVSLRDAERELRDIEEKLKTAERRSVAQVEATIAAAFARPVVIGERVRGTVATVSGNCSRHDGRTAEACEEIAKLRTDVARALETKRLDERAIFLRDTISSLRDRGGASPPDPVGEFWSWVTRGFFTARDVGFGLPLAFAIMIEMVSAFGPLGIVTYAEVTNDATRRGVTRHVATVRDTSPVVATEVSEQLIAYIAERTEPTESVAGVAIDELFADYRAWRKEGRGTSLRFQEFVRGFDALRGSPELEDKIKKIGARYFGIALASENNNKDRVQSVA